MRQYAAQTFRRRGRLFTLISGLLTLYRRAVEVNFYVRYQPSKFASPMLATRKEFKPRTISIVKVGKVVTPGKQPPRMLSSVSIPEGETSFTSATVRQSQVARLTTQA